MSMEVRTVYKIAKKDLAFISALKAAGERIPLGMFADRLEQGMWASYYSGWILGMFGATELLRREAEWRLL